MRLARCVGELDGYAELKRTDGSTTVLRVVWRTLPRNGGAGFLLLCPHCDTPRHCVYGWDETAFRIGQTESSGPIGVAALVIGCATLAQPTSPADGANATLPSGGLRLRLKVVPSAGYAREVVIQLAGLCTLSW